MSLRVRDAVLAILAGFAFIAPGGYIMHSQLQAEQTSVAVDATVVESSVAELPQKNKYTPDITYRYTYDNRTYTNDNVWIGTTKHRLDHGTAKDVVEDYPEGATVTAHVYPDDPSQSYLRAGSQGYFLPVGLIVLGFIPVLVGIAELRNQL